MISNSSVSCYEQAADVRQNCRQREREGETWGGRGTWQTIKLQVENHFSKNAVYGCLLKVYLIKVREIYHSLVGVGRKEWLALIGRRVRDVQYVVLCRFKSAATGWHKKKAHSPFTFHSVPMVYNKAWMLTQNSCNKMETTASPRFISTCESVHTVNKEVRSQRRKQII